MNVIMVHNKMGEKLMQNLFGKFWWPVGQTDNPSCMSAMGCFMILSGFVRYQAAKGRPRYDSVASRTYAVRLLARLVPSYYLALALLLLLGLGARAGAGAPPPWKPYI